MWDELQLLRSQLDIEQQERRAASFMERMQFAQLRQATEMLRRSLLAGGVGGSHPQLPGAAYSYAAAAPNGVRAAHAAVGSPSAPATPAEAAASELRRQQQMYVGVAELHRRLHDEKARHAGFASELRSFARHMKIDVTAATPIS